MTSVKWPCKGDWRWARWSWPTSPGSAAPSWRRTKSSSSTSARTIWSARASTTKKSPPGSSSAAPPTNPDRSFGAPGAARAQRRRKPPSTGTKTESKKTPERLVRGSDAAEKLFASFAPLRASRGLGILPADKLKDLGLDNPRNASPSCCALASAGSPSPPRPPEAPNPTCATNERPSLPGRRSFLSDFQTAASLLVERHIHAFRLEEADRIAVSQAPPARIPDLARRRRRAPGSDERARQARFFVQDLARSRLCRVAHRCAGQGRSPPRARRRSSCALTTACAVAAGIHRNRQGRHRGQRRRSRQAPAFRTQRAHLGLVQTRGGHPTCRRTGAAALARL
jgi:hypothetical protein